MPKVTQKRLFEHRIKMQGYAVGYEILQGGITVKKVDFDYPVSNMVVNSGKDFICAPDAEITDSNYPGKSANPISAATRYMARGSGSTPTSADMTTLESQIGSRTDEYLAGDPYTGVRYNKSTGIIYLRKTYDSETEVSNQNINEVGFFTAASGGVMFSRVVLPSTVTVLTGQQLRITYELQVTIGPIAPTADAPAITGWTTDGDSQLEGFFPDTSATFGSVGNQFISVWDTNGNSICGYDTGSNSDYVWSNLLEPALSSQYYLWGSFYYTYSTSEAQSVTEGLPVVMYNSKTFSTFGTAATAVSPSASIFVALQDGSNSTGTATGTLLGYTSGTGYRDLQIKLEPNWPAANISPIALRIRGLTHIFDAAQTKLNTQRLTLIYRITLV
jgi:hypothetical protein